MVDLVEEPFSIGSWEFIRHTFSLAASVSDHELALVVLEEISWRLRIVNLTSGLIPEPLLGFVVSHLVLQEQVSSGPVGSPVLGVSGEHEVVVGLLVGFLKMEVHAFFWLHGRERWLRLHVGHVEIKLFVSVAVKNLNVESDITIVRNNASTEWSFCPGAAP